MTDRRLFLGLAAATAAATAAVALPSKVRAQASNAASTGRVRTKDGADLFVKDWGSGRPVILTHAWPLSSDCWDHQPSHWWKPAIE